MKITTDDYELELVQERDEDGGKVYVFGDAESLECFKDSVELAGHSRDAGMTWELVESDGASRGSQNGAQGFRVDPGTVALWLDFEILNFLKFERHN